MNPLLFISKKYLFPKFGNKLIHIITWIAVINMIIAAASMLIILSVFSGLENLVLDQQSKWTPDILVSPKNGKKINFDLSIYNNIKKYNGVKELSAVIEEKVFVSYENKNMISNLKGVDENYPKAYVMDSILKAGRLFENNHEVILGFEAAQELSTNIINPKKIVLRVPKPGKGQITNINNNFESYSAFPVGYFSVDNKTDKYLIADINLTRELLNYEENQASSLEIVTDDNINPYEMKLFLKKQFKEEVVIKTRKEQDASFFKVMKIEKLITYLIFIIIIFLMSIGISAAIVLTIIEKQKDIKSLYSIGFDKRKISKIFLFQGIWISFLGTISGVFIGAIIVYIQKYFGIIKINFSYKVTPYPIDIELINILIVSSTVFIIGIIFSYLSSRIYIS